MSTDTLRSAATERILLLDGASGSEIQALGVTEDDLRGERFADHARSLAGNNDLLVLTRPDAVRQLHRGYLAAGADIVSTNTFSSTTVAQREYGLDDPALVHDLNVAGARLAREMADDASRADGRPRWVAGAIGPTNVTLSLSPRVEDPAYRALTFRELAQSYREQIAGLVAGGVDVLLVETVFDTLNAKAAIWAARRHAAETGITTPLMISGTITDRSGRTLSGQTVGAFWQSVRHAAPLSVGLNCALGGAEMRPYVQEIAGLADTLVCAYPNAGLPNELGCYDETPEQTAAIIGEFARSGFVNIVGGCCGTTAAHIEAIADAVRGVAPRRVAERHPRLQLSGLESFTLTDDVPFVNVGERTNVTGSAKFRRLITNGDFAEALDVARQQVENGAQIIDVNMDEGLLDSKQAMVTFLNLIATEPDIARVPVMIDSSKFEVIEAGLECVQGKAVVNSISMKEGDRPVPRPGPGLSRPRCCGDRDGVRRGWPGRHGRPQGRDLLARVRTAPERARLPSRTTSSSTRTSSPSRPASPSTTGTASTSSRRPQSCEAGSRTRTCRAACPTCRSRSAGTTGFAKRCIRCSCTTRSRTGCGSASSTPANSPSTKGSTPSSASCAKTSCSLVVPMPPNACWTQRRPTSVRAPPRSNGSASSGATGMSTSGSSTHSSTASPSSSKTMSRNRVFGWVHRSR